MLGDTTLAMWTSSLSSSAGQPGSGSFGPLALYAGASLGAVGIMYARSLVLVAASMRAAVRVHNAALWRVLRAPMSWLDATPNGRITNRFQSDQQKLDLMLPATVGNVLAAGAAMLSALIVVCATAPAVLLLLPPVAALFVHYQVPSLLPRQTSGHCPHDAGATSTAITPAGRVFMLPPYTPLHSPVTDGQAKYVLTGDHRRIRSIFVLIPLRCHD